MSNFLFLLLVNSTYILTGLALEPGSGSEEANENKGHRLFLWWQQFQEDCVTTSTKHVNRSIHNKLENDTFFIIIMKEQNLKVPTFLWLSHGGLVSNALGMNSLGMSLKLVPLFKKKLLYTFFSFFPVFSFLYPPFLFPIFLPFFHLLFSSPPPPPHYCILDYISFSLPLWDRTDGNACGQNTALYFYFLGKTLFKFSQ